MRVDLGKDLSSRDPHVRQAPEHRLSWGDGCGIAELSLEKQRSFDSICAKLKPS